MSSLLSHKSVRIKKSTRGHETPKGGVARPDHVLVDRNQQWKHVTKSLLHYYQGLSEIEATHAKSTTALLSTIQVPFHEGHAFLGDDGWQQVLYDVRDETKLLAEQHQSFHETIDKTVVAELESVRADIKAHISAIEKEAGAIADQVDKERESSSAALTTLGQGIDTFEHEATAMLPQHDPVITHQQAHAQLTKQVHKENELQAAVIRFQQQQGEFEAGVVRSIQSAVKLYDEAKATKEAEIKATEAKISTALHRVTPEAEHDFWAAKAGAIIDPNTAPRNVDAISYPGHKHASSVPIKEGHLERKKRFTKSYKESFYTLSPSGYLHERKSSDPANTTAPTFSLFLPECTLSAVSKESDKSHKFSVEGNKAHRSSGETKVKNVLRFGGKEIAYTFRARTHAQAVEWWTALDKLSRDTETPAPAPRVAHQSSIERAVLNAGYAQSFTVATPAAEKTEADAIASAVTGAGVKSDPALETNEAGIAALPNPEAATAPVEEFDDEEETGGSSAEEEEEEFSAARTGTTPAATTGVGSPLEAAGSLTEANTAKNRESLPGYVSGGASAPAEKAALPEKWTGAGVPPALEAEASTSTA